jgi:hypothetical protein
MPFTCGQVHIHVHIYSHALSHVHNSSQACHNTTQSNDIIADNQEYRTAYQVLQGSHSAGSHHSTSIVDVTEQPPITPQSCMLLPSSQDSTVVDTRMAGSIHTNMRIAAGINTQAHIAARGISIHTLALTWLAASTAAPALRSALTTCTRPSLAAQMRGVQPSCSHTTAYRSASMHACWSQQSGSNPIQSDQLRGERDDR